MVPIIDIFLILFLAGFVFYGFFFGLIRTIGSLAGFVAGAWLASHYYLGAYQYIQKFFLGYDSFGKIFTFFVIFLVASKLVSFAFAILDRTFNLISIIPFLSSINKLGGALFGLALGVFALGLIVHFAYGLPLLGGLFGRWLEFSKIMPYIIGFNKLIAPLLPVLIEKARGMA